jgi:hypothetical protein
LDANQFRHFWQEHFPNCLPVSYLFKRDLANRWFRFHSLPESKRYPEDQIEVAELLARQNTVLLDVIGTDNECVLVSGNYADLPLVENLKHCPALAQFQFHEFAKLSKQEFDPNDSEPNEEPLYLTLLYETHKLKQGSLDEVLLCVADWKIVNFFVVSCERQRIFAPYDGGVDVILKDTEERNKFKAKYKDWLSYHPKGL